MAQEGLAPPITGPAPTRSIRAAASIVRRLDFLPATPRVGPVVYSRGLVAFVVLAGVAAAALAFFTVRAPGDWGTLALGAASVFLMSVYAIKALPPVQALWTPSVFVHLGLSVAIGPAGALAASVAESLGVGLRNRNGWFRTCFNISNQFLANTSAWAAFYGVERIAGRGAGGAIASGVAAGVAQYLVNNGLFGVVIRLVDRTVPTLTVLRSRLAVLPYSVGYGVAAFSFVIMHEAAGVLGFLALLAPVILLQGFLVVFARRVHTYEEQRAAHQKEREELLQKAVEASEHERRRIARDLHDGVVQNLAGMAFSLSATATKLKDRAAEHSELELVKTLELSATETRSAMKDLRTLIIELAPPTLRREGLQAALLEVLRALKRKGTRTTLDLPPNLRLREDRAALIFRVAQEVLRNVDAHAQAKNVTVELKTENGMAILRIADDGRGFTERDVARRRAQGHLGTTAIAELAEEAQGTLIVDSEPGKGTRVTLSLPVE